MVLENSNRLERPGAERCFVRGWPELVSVAWRALVSCAGTANRQAGRVELRLVIEVNADGEKFCAE
jgi:hypothetical protein